MNRRNEKRELILKWKVANCADRMGITMHTNPSVGHTHRNAILGQRYRAQGRPVADPQRTAMFAPISTLLPSHLDVTAGEEIARGYVQCRR